jgi:prepilin-type N-terminal cleavage/methylation domain-containing protein
MLRGIGRTVQNHGMKGIRASARGFTIVELMIVVGIIAILASLAIPGYQRITARSHRTEMQAIMSKFRLYFKNLHDSQGSFSTSETLAAGASSAVNPTPTPPPGTAGPWVTNASGWINVPFTPEGAIRMRYWYTMGTADADGRVHDITLQACGSFPGYGPNTQSCTGGMNGNFLYTEVLHGNGTSDVVEIPDF